MIEYLSNRRIFTQFINIGFQLTKHDQIIGLKKRVQQDHSFIIPKKENKIVELIQSILKIMNFLILSMKNIKI